jgi:hypothetical protein
VDVDARAGRRPVTEEASAQQKPRNLAKTLLAVGWIYGGRGVGLLWTFALISKLSISDYGLYGMGFALMSLVGPPLDNPYQVRSARESEKRFVEERSSRFLLGLSLMFVGALLIPVHFILWFGLFVAGGEIVFKSLQSQASRNGDPQHVWRMDTMRQVSSVSIACGYLFAADHPTLHTAALLYCAPYLVIAVLAGFTALRHLPRLPGPPKAVLILIGETLGLAAYLQGDVLLLGWLTDAETVGYYQLCITVVIAIATIGQSFGVSFHESLRESGGDLTKGPQRRNIVMIGAASAVVVFIIGVGLLISPAPTELAVTMLIMSLFCGMRSISAILQVVLYVQHRDFFRLAANVSMVPPKLALVALLASFGAIGAAVATVIVDAILLGIYWNAVYGKAATARQTQLRESAADASATSEPAAQPGEPTDRDVQKGQP